MTSTAVALSMAATGASPHRLLKQSGPETMVPAAKTTKFDDSGGTKSQQSLEIRLAIAPR
jgi:hypothetical protein